MKMKITVFTAPHCSYCTEQKNWMLQNNIKFEEKDISDSKNFEEFKLIKGIGTPLTVFEMNNEVKKIVGFNKIKLSKELGVENVL